MSEEEQRELLEDLTELLEASGVEGVYEGDEGGIGLEEGNTKIQLIANEIRRLRKIRGFI